MCLKYLRKDKPETGNTGFHQEGSSLDDRERLCSVNLCRPLNFKTQKCIIYLSKNNSVTLLLPSRERQKVKVI